MSTFDLDAFVERARTLTDAAPPATPRETRAWLVDPLLETLGWDVHGNACLLDTTVDGTDLEYVCSVGGVPALFVAVERYGESLSKARAVSLLETMAWTGVDRAIYTDGRDVLLLAGTTDVDRLACHLPELTAHESAVAHFTRETVGQRLERHARPYVARQLAIERTALVDAIVAELSAVTDRGDAHRAEFESAADRFVERLVASFSDDRTEPVGELEAAETEISIEFSESSIGDTATDPDDEFTGSASGTATEPNGETTSSPGSTASDSSVSPEKTDGTQSDHSHPRPPDASGDAEGADESDRTGSTDRTDTADDSDDSEYVVRVFNDRGSIGAVGHSRSAQALVSAAEFLFERGLSGITVPWSPDDDAETRAALNESPTHPDGTPMGNPQQLSNGLYLETDGTVADHAERVEALVARAGFRAMLSGDW
ncbi:hypothetical protein [Natronolimnohabitans innermongolicus]|uniref:Uncharacterized protein n=1 Tax=Natronolimnohabitans innermongolicus JCM 12255 TaxID=1227499 RepID=L9XGL0_9EURY|nr:hypothetical protein [Natronolimnohabitans innermongolicus]ELY60752.1 hypothetical protein C493_03582 [Natronolimnohabitans innermongolicus JCM 12255]